MGLERKSTTYGEVSYTRLMGTQVTSKEEVAILAEIASGGNYFYGGVLDTGSGLQVYFGQGPNHIIFEQMILESFGIEGDIASCQINISRRTNNIYGLLFLEDPGKNKDNITIDERDREGKKRRREKIKALVQALSPDICEAKMVVGWIEGESAYVYLPQSGVLKQVYKISS